MDTDLKKLIIKRKLDLMLKDWAEIGMEDIRKDYERTSAWDKLYDSFLSCWSRRLYDELELGKGNIKVEDTWDRVREVVHELGEDKSWLSLPVSQLMAIVNNNSKEIAVRKLWIKATGMNKDSIDIDTKIKSNSYNYKIEDCGREEDWWSEIKMKDCEARIE